MPRCLCPRRFRRPLEYARADNLAIMIRLVAHRVRPARVGRVTRLLLLFLVLFLVAVIINVLVYRRWRVMFVATTRCGHKRRRRFEYRRHCGRQWWLSKPTVFVRVVVVVISGPFFKRILIRRRRHDRLRVHRDAAVVVVLGRVRLTRRGRRRRRRRRRGRVHLLLKCHMMWIIIQWQWWFTAYYIVVGSVPHVDFGQAVQVNVRFFCARRR